MPNLSLWTEQLFCLPTVENIHPFASIGAQFLLRESQRFRTVITTVLETLCRRNRWLYPAHTVRTAIRCTIATNSRPLDGFRPTPVGPSISVAICRLVFTNSGGSERSLDVKRATCRSESGRLSPSPHLGSLKLLGPVPTSPDMKRARGKGYLCPYRHS